MEKYKYSSLTDDQQEKILKQIGWLKSEASDLEAQFHEERIMRFMHALVGFEFIRLHEFRYYRGLIENAMAERKENRHGNLSEQ